MAAPELAGAAEPQSSLPSHVHGQAQLTLVAEGTVLQAEARLPAMDVVGFEHRPQTDAQQQQLDAAVAALADPARLLTVPADCSGGSAEVRVERDSHENHDHADHHGHDEHEKHHDHHDHGKDHDHDDHHHDHDHGEHQDHDDHHGGDAHAAHEHSAHSELVVRHQWQCEDLGNPTLSVALFNHYPLEQVAVQWVWHSRQGAANTTPTQPQFQPGR